MAIETMIGVLTANTKVKYPIKHKTLSMFAHSL